MIGTFDCEDCYLGAINCSSGFEVKDCVNMVDVFLFDLRSIVNILVFFGTLGDLAILKVTLG
jgi:hypothetical protein